MRMIPGISSARLPSISTPIRPSRYGGVQITAPNVPLTALAITWSRRERTGLAPISRAGIRT